ncbi:dihydroxyacetone kinase phosphoryl donor subunit DhaM [Arthrobacter castelli]|uniref:dihydroxyacetone kinase phosphoryl donor subunit DhaM n=1 Tax=Arthrobacter castelli TaxID=271431 RepID=UPI000411433F|nr:dihydroxyacetone kinase phosphoryl donor subunit DhaM [Arthrobacter castelli]
MSVGLLIISHSAKIAEGVCELAAQMAADVVLVPAGGTDDGGIGTSFEKVQSGIEKADTGDGVLILTDLGSAVMTAESALEFLEDAQRNRVRMQPDVPLVEGAIAAAVAAQTGVTLEAVVQGAQSAQTGAPAGGTQGEAASAEPAIAPSGSAEQPAEPSESAIALSPEPAGGAGGVESASGDVELINPMGLHARPAAVTAQELTGMDADITINGVDAKSVMLLMTLGLKQGQTLHVAATGPDARKAVDFVTGQAADGFGEL